MPLDDDADDERPEFSSPLPPDDRLWRHPSEVAAERAATGGYRPLGPRRAPGADDPGRSRRRNLAASGAVVLGAAAIIGLVVFASTVRDEPVTTTVVDQAALGVPATPAPSVTGTGAGPSAAARSWLGVRGGDFDDDDGTGAALMQVDAGSPAEHGGLRSGDVVTAVDGRRLGSMAELLDEVRRHDPGSQMNITFRRGGEVRGTTVVLGTAAQPANQVPEPTTPTPGPPTSSAPTPTAAPTPTTLVTTTVPDTTTTTVEPPGH